MKPSSAGQQQLSLEIACPDDDTQTRKTTDEENPPENWAGLFGTSSQLPISMATIGDLFRVGPTHDLIGHLSGNDGRGSFEFLPIEEGSEGDATDTALWSADCKGQRSLVVLPTHKGLPVAGKDQDRMRDKQGRLFYARNMSWASQALLAAITEQAHMGGTAWTVLDHDDIRICKAFSIWANSTAGMIVHWTQSQRTHPGRSRTQVGAVSQIPCPKIDDLPDTALDRAAVLFDDLAKHELAPACQAHRDPIRQDIDSAVIRMLGLPFGVRLTIKRLCDQWCRETSVHGRNRAALALLEKAAYNSQQ